MRMEFANAEHAAVDLNEDATTIGSGRNCDVRLHGAGVGVHHARLERSGDELNLFLQSTEAVTRLNGRVLHHAATVHVGDVLAFGPISCQLVDTAVEAPDSSGVDGNDADDKPNTARTRMRQALPRWVLRGLSGPTLGRSFALDGVMICGRQRDCDISIESLEVSRRHARVALTSLGVEVDDLDSSNGTFINDQRISHGILKPGDELRLDVVRFVLIAPGATALSRPTEVRPVRPAWPLLVGLAAAVVLILIALAL